jgi:hypothetical protein
LVILPFILGKKKKSFSDYLITVLGEAPSIFISMFVVEVAFLGRYFIRHKKEKKKHDGLIVPSGFSLPFLILREHTRGNVCFDEFPFKILHERF